MSSDEAFVTEVLAALRESGLEAIVVGTYGGQPGGNGVRASHVTGRRRLHGGPGPAWLRAGPLTVRPG